ncbi:uncharacterized protein BJX67DRAFT_371109 [Aspergillus lucknowensis]|uniref:PUM-HD domain-containing protein n=1 Tax=Aspergillus lucknowensis TaxID=176173 RepID=A0ABR4LVY7_9EURO
MAFKNGLSERLDELRFPSPRSPPSETPFPSYSALSPGHSTLVSAFSRPTGDVRANLQRRFTTDASKVSSWNYINHVGPPPQVPDALDLLSSFEKKRQHIEYMREQKRRFEEDMKLLDLQHEKEQHEMNQLAKDLAKAGISGPVSEPTTPPEHRENGFPGAFSRPTRFSTSSVTSSPGFFNVFASVTSPPSQGNHEPAQTATNRFAVHSVPGSRRNSEREDFGPEPTSPFRPGPSIHRYSMPTTGLGSQIRPNISTFNNSSLDTFNTAKYLLHSDDDRSTLKDEDRIPTPDIKSYLKLTEPDDKFPTLSRSDGSNFLSANSDALDLANSKTPNPESWNSHNRHRSSHQSMPQNALNMFRLGQIGGSADESHIGPQNPSRHAARHSLEANVLYSADGNHQDPVSSTASNRPAPLQSSYSTNDLPTVKGESFNSAITPPKTHTEQLHHHNTSLGRIPVNATTPRQQKDSPEREEARPQNSRAHPTTLQANAMPFGPQLNAPASGNANAPQASLSNFQPPFYGYGIQAYMGAPMQVNGQIQPYNPSPSFTGYPSYGNYRLGDNPPKPVTSRRNTDGDSAQLSRFTNFPLEHYRGEIYGLCKDQHGCRYLQRKLEERNLDHVQMIFDETLLHVVELMTDPFGNYLCQKLLEYSNDDQRTALINNAAHQLVKIALNQHGTRALQKMIEFISTPEQTSTVIQSLKDHVVELVQDLNGNHVIQKCLNRLSAEDSQFIYDAVGANCVVVGTHRHGCCVLQRCIDHASGEQRARLIGQITSNAFALVQDPFGNYVVQYILDLAEAHFTEPLCRAFRGNIPALSKQKFSSNVIEKCLRTAEPPIRRQMIDEMLSGVELEKMLRDSFANYVVQTAMDFADTETRNRIVECVRPILPSIRQTPHGRRIAGKMMASEGTSRGSAATSGQVTPNEMNSAQLPGPLQAPQKNFMYQHTPFPISAGGTQFGNQGFVPASGTGSTSNTPSGASENSSSIYSTAVQPQNPRPSSPSTVVVHGISATCKSTIVSNVLATLQVPHAIVRSPECITGRHLLTKILWATLDALGRRDEWERFGKGRCEHVSSLMVLLAECLTSNLPGKPIQKFVLVLDGIDKQREAPPTLLPALARLGEVIPSLTVVLILSSTPRPLFLQATGVPHINFPPYTRKEAITIVLNAGLPAVLGLPAEISSQLFPHFVAAIYDSLVGPTASSIPVFKSICEKLWPQFVFPITSGEPPPGGNEEWDFSRLLVKNRGLFRRQGEAALVHHIVTEDSPLTTTGSLPPPPSLLAVSAPSPLPYLPYFATLVLTSAYLASHTPQRLDTIFFSKFSSSSLSARNKRAHHRRRLKVLSQAQAAEETSQGSSTPSRRGKGKRTKTRITKSTLDSAFATSSATTSASGGGPGITGPSTILTARPFPLERLIAIYHAIDPNPPANPLRLTAVADMIYAELATLRRLRLVVPAAGRASGSRMGLGSAGVNSGNTTADVGEKWCVNVSGDWIGEMAKGIGVEVGEWLAGGLD